MLYSIFKIIIDTIAGLLAAVLLLRFWMQVVRVRPPAPLANFTFQLSDWLVLPLRKVIPGVGGYDWASLLATFLISLVAHTLEQLWRGDIFSAFNVLPIVLSILLAALIGMVIWMVYGFMGLLILGAVFSWINPSAPFAPFVNALNDPILRPLRRVVPLIGNIDLSPLVALILLQIALFILIGR